MDIKIKTSYSFYANTTSVKWKILVSLKEQGEELLVKFAQLLLLDGISIDPICEDMMAVMDAIVKTIADVPINVNISFVLIVFFLG